MKTLLKILPILITLSGCAQTELENVEPIEAPTKERIRKAPTVQGITGTWIADIETSQVMNAQYAHPTITLTAIGNDQLLLNGQDTLCLQSPDRYVGCMQFNKLQTGVLNGAVLTHCELYADPITQTSYYVCLEYTR